MTADQQLGVGILLIVLTISCVGIMVPDVPIAMSIVGRGALVGCSAVAGYLLGD